MKKNKCILMSFSNGIGNFVMLTPTLVAIQKLGYSIDFLLHYDDKDPRLEAIKDIVDNWYGVGYYDRKKEYDHCFYVWGEGDRKLPEHLKFKMTSGLINNGQYNPAYSWFIGNHEVVVNFEIARFLGFNGKIPEMYIPAKFDVFKKKEVNDVYQYHICIHVGSRPENVWAKKRWPTKNWIDLINLIDKFYPMECSFYFLKSEWEKKNIDEILNHFDVNDSILKLRMNFVENFTITETANVIGQSDLLITTDSGPMHIAAAVGTSVISLFGPTLPSKNDPWDSEGVVLQNKKLKCCPCLYTSHFTACKDNKCMQNITPVKVFEAVRNYLPTIPNISEIRTCKAPVRKIHFVMPYWTTKPNGQESRLQYFLRSGKDRELNLEYEISDLRLNPYKLDNFKKQYDATIVFKGEMLNPGIIKMMTGTKVLYFPDDIVVYKNYNDFIRSVGKYFDIVYTFDQKMIPEFYKLNCRDVRWWPSCTGKDMFYDQGLKRDIDICFIGSMNEKRKEMLDKVREAFPDKKLFFESGIKGFEYATYLNRSKIVLNLAQGGGTSQRVFEATACGALVMDYIPYDDLLLCYTDASIGQDIVAWDTYDCLIASLKYQLNNPDQLKKIAKHGKLTTISKHLIDHRFVSMLKDIEQFKKENIMEVNV